MNLPVGRNAWVVLYGHTRECLLFPRLSKYMLVNEYFVEILSVRNSNVAT